ncbi:MAG: redoxin domain-containing protein, partial [Bacteroidetes bacterium]|nr:redoxin domain-containing protein [Bacteroidota bacterium]
QNALSDEYHKKAALTDSANADYAWEYLFTFEHGDQRVYRQKVFDFVKRFPTSERSAQALYWLGERTTNLNDRIAYLEELRKLYPPQKFRWSASGMEILADIYLQTDPKKALTLIDEMGDGDSWKIRRHISESLIQVAELELAQNYSDAIAKLNQVKLPQYNSIKDFLLLKKASLLEKSGNLNAAYDSVAMEFAKLPSDQLDTALQSYGRKLNKNRDQIAKDIETIRDSTAVAAFPFELGLYTSNSKLSLHDLKGKVVLLTFWFPACGPCGAEFPHFEAVMDKFKGRPVAYIGIDVTPLQDADVLPFLKNNKYSFMPLRGDQEFAFKNFGVTGEPENFLIDEDGKIVFKDFRIDGTNHRTLEMMISSLLEKGRKAE